MIDILPWLPVAVGVATAVIVAYFLGIEVGKDRARKEVNGK